MNHPAFFVGLHQPGDAIHFERAFLSVHRLRGRKKPIGARQWIMDSGAFTQLATHGQYHCSVRDYARQINRWTYPGSGLIAAVAQDWMCEPWILRRTGLTIPQHQALTIDRYDALLPLVRSTYVMPVIQGYAASDYVRHLTMYASRLRQGAYAGVGSLCKRNTSTISIECVLTAIKRERPDLQLHGFGLKTTALRSPVVRQCLVSADSMAWSYAARKRGRNPNDWREARHFLSQVARPPSSPQRKPAHLASADAHALRDARLHFRLPPIRLPASERSPVLTARTFPQKRKSRGARG